LPIKPLNIWRHFFRKDFVEKFWSLNIDIKSYVCRRKDENIFEYCSRLIIFQEETKHNDGRQIVAIFALSSETVLKILQLKLELSFRRYTFYFEFRAWLCRRWDIESCLHFETGWTDEFVKKSPQSGSQPIFVQIIA
jgi:hypothetical protein